MAVITIGAEIADGGQQFGNDYTILNYNHPANGTGKITAVSIKYGTDATGVKVIIFEEVGANTFTARSSAALGDLAAGEHADIAVDLDVVAGDFIAFYQVTGNPRFIDNGHDGIYRKAGDQSAGVGVDFGAFLDDDGEMWALGEGETVAVGGAPSGSVGGLLIL
ncbi:hypothetical protein ES703_12797 [subsurface metagenome]